MQTQERTNHFVKPLYDFWAVLEVVEAIGKHYGRFQLGECKRIKDRLLVHESASGRVPLSQFYSLAAELPGHFQESQAYLGQLGILDESISHEPSVVIANYVQSPANCIASSPDSFYSVCCLGECDALLAHLEEAVAGPEATPARIMELVARLPSSTVQAPRRLPQELLSRLDDIAAIHGEGAVPLHGRLFAQWLHHAYPRECPFPRGSPMAPEEWLAETGESCFASPAEVERFAARALPSTPPAELPWSSQEQLFVARLSARERWAHAARTSFRRLMQGLVLCTCAVSFAATLWHSLPALVRGSRKLQQEDDVVRLFV